MEPLPERSPTRTDGVVPPERQLRPGGGKMGRITQQTRGLVDDLTRWIELRIELAQKEMEERIEAKANQIALKVVLGVLGALAGLFALFTLAFALGAWLGHPAWGFLIVTFLLVLLAVVVRAAHPEFIQLGGPQAREKKPPA